MDYQEKQTEQKFCKHCGQKINAKAVICPLCGCQVEEIQQNNSQTASVPNIVITNTNTNTNVNKNYNGGGGRWRGKPKNKWISFFLCLFTFCGHKFYEGKTAWGVIYLCTGGLFLIGWIVDLINLWKSPNPYYVK